jgi:hypothetical protein
MHWTSSFHEVQLSEHDLNARVQAEIVPIKIAVQILYAVRILGKGAFKGVDRELLLAECVLDEGDFDAAAFPGLALDLHYLAENPLCLG